MASTPEFSYSPLNNASMEIRLLSIDHKASSDQGGIVSVTLDHFTRGTSLVYDAFSYTWGDESKTKLILVNGKRFNVTQNLHSALLQLQGFQQDDDYSRNEFIWIDAICINQKDNKEKSAQVRIMRYIFSDAAQVIICLGLTEQHSLGVETISLLAEAYEDYKALNANDPLDAASHYDSLLETLRDFLKQNHESQGELTDSISQIFNLPWWERVWIIQEVAVAKQAFALFGSTGLGFEYFKHFYNTVRELEKIPDSDVAEGWSLHIDQAMACTGRVHSVLWRWLSAKTPMLTALKMVFVGGNSKATDPRDRFYALSGLRVDVEQIVGNVDYSLPWRDLYIKAATALVTEDLRTLAFCAPSKERHESGLPSWVPDWTRYIPYPLSIRAAESMGFGSTLYAACQRRYRLRHDLTFDASHRAELAIRGFYVAKIRTVSDPWPLPPATQQSYPWELSIPAAKAWHDSITKLAESLGLTNEA